MAKKAAKKETENERNVRIGQKLADMLGEMVGTVTDLALDNDRLAKELAAAQAKLKEAGIV